MSTKIKNLNETLMHEIGQLHAKSIINTEELEVFLQIEHKINLENAKAKCAEELIQKRKNAIALREIKAPIEVIQVAREINDSDQVETTHTDNFNQQIKENQKIDLPNVETTIKKLNKTVKETNKDLKDLGKSAEKALSDDTPELTSDQKFAMIYKKNHQYTGS